MAGELPGIKSKAQPPHWRGSRAQLPLSHPSYEEQGTFVSLLQEHRKKRAPTYVPSDSKPESIVHISCAELGNAARKRKPSCHFSKTLHHGEDSDTSEGVTQENGQRTSSCEGGSNTQEETCADSSSKSDELYVASLQSAERDIISNACAIWRNQPTLE